MIWRTDWWFSQARRWWGGKIGKEGQTTSYKCHGNILYDMVTIINSIAYLRVTESKSKSSHYRKKNSVTMYGHD